jgi:hypothetical protein
MRELRAVDASRLVANDSSRSTAISSLGPGSGVVAYQPVTAEAFAVNPLGSTHFATADPGCSPTACHRPLGIAGPGSSAGLSRSSLSSGVGVMVGLGEAVEGDDDAPDGSGEVVETDGALDAAGARSDPVKPLSPRGSRATTTTAAADPVATSAWCRRRR